MKLPSYFSICEMLDLAVRQTENNLKSWFNVYLDKSCHKSIQKLKTVTLKIRETCTFYSSFGHIFVLFAGYFVFYATYSLTNTTFYLFNDRKVNSLAPKQLRNFVSATYSFWKNPTLMATPRDALELAFQSI